MDKTINQIIEELKETGIMINKTAAAAILKCSRARFDKLYVKTDIITPINLPHTRYAQYSLTEVLSAPDKLVDLEQLKRNRDEQAINRQNMSMEEIFESCYRTVERERIAKGW